MNIERERHFERTTPRYTEWRLVNGSVIRFKPTSADGELHAERLPVYAINPRAWGRVLARNIDDVVEQSLTNELIAWIRDNPATFAPANPQYVKTHVNAPGTVRAWFRQMRAADFERDKKLWEARSYGLIGWDGPLDDGSSLRRFHWFAPHGEIWTLFDTQKLVDRETSPHYRRFDDLLTVTISSTPAGRKSYIERMFATDEWWFRDLRMGDWNVAEPLAGLDAGAQPSTFFHGRLPAPGEGRGITREDLRTFVRDGDAHRADRMCMEQFRAAVRCSRCHGEVRLTGAPHGYVGPVSCSLLYHYAKLLESDFRYRYAKPEVWMCDACQIAGVVSQ